MATAAARASLGLDGGAESGQVYGKRDNIKVPDCDQADALLTIMEASAAPRESDRHGSSAKFATQRKLFTPDSADYTCEGAERTVN